MNRFEKRSKETYNEMAAEYDSSFEGEYTVQFKSLLLDTVTIRPDDADSWAELVRVLWATGDAEGARDALVAFERLFPRDPRLQILRTQVQKKAVDINCSQRGEA